MKSLLVLVVSFFVATSAARAQTFSITLNAGLLENALGTAPVQNGMLLELLASPTGVFSAPTSTAYVTGDNVLVTSFAMNSSSGTAGLTVNSLTSLALTNMLTPGEKLELRFYPSLTYATPPANPTLGTTYGQVRSSTVEYGPPTDPFETAWVVPSGQGNVDFDYVTTSGGGTYSNTSAYATNVVLIGVPEPSPYALLIAGGVGVLVGGRSARRRLAA